jgi:hypothetical protein
VADLLCIDESDANRELLQADPGGRWDPAVIEGDPVSASRRDSLRFRGCEGLDMEAKGTSAKVADAATNFVEAISCNRLES